MQGARVRSLVGELRSHMLYQFSSVAQSCPTHCNPMDCSTPGFPVHHHLPELAQTHAIKSVMPSNHLVLYRSLHLLPSIFPSVKVFSNESALCIRWPKYWSFIFIISPSNEYSRLISFRMWSPCNYRWLSTCFGELWTFSGESNVDKV